MKRCSKCKISYNGNLKRCPLCQAELSGKNSVGVFPKIKTKKENLLNKILLFTSIAVAITFSFVEYNIHKQLTISKYVSLSLFTCYILVIYIIKKYKNILKIMNKYFIIILILTFLWFFITKSLIITSYIIPILCIIILIYNSITMLVLKDSYIIKFLKIILIDSLIGLIPWILTLLSLITHNILSNICLLLDILILIGLLIFCKENVIEEFKKLFNI